MQKYEVNGQVYEFPDDMSEEDVLNIISTEDPQAFQPTPTTGNAQLDSVITQRNNMEDTSEFQSPFVGTPLGNRPVSQAQMLDVLGINNEAPVDTPSTGPQPDPNQPYNGLFTPVEPQYEEVQSEVSTDPMGGSLGTSYSLTNRVQKFIPPSELVNNSDWMTASSMLYKQATGKDFEGNPEDLADFGVQTAQWFRNNLTLGAAVDAVQVARMPMEARQAFLYLLDTYEQVGTPPANAARAIGYQMMDPLTWFGLATIIPSGGLSGAAVQAGRVASMQALKQLIRTGLIAGTEIGLYSGAQNLSEQSVEKSAGRRAEIDLGETGKSVGAGFVMGAALGPFAEIILGGPKPKVKGGKTPPAPIVAKVEDNVVTLPQVEDDFLSLKVPLKTEVTDVTPAPQMPRANDEFMAAVERTANEAATPPVTIQDVVGSIKEISTRISEGITPDDVSTLATQTASLFQRLGINDASDVGNVLSNMNFTKDEINVLINSTREAYENVGKSVADLIKRERAAAPEDVAAIRAQRESLQGLQESIKTLEVPLSSDTGRNLQARVGGTFVNENRGLSVESILKEQGIDDPKLATPEQVIKAEDEYVARVDARLEQVENNSQIRELEANIRQAFADGDIATASRIAGERDALVTVMKEKEAERLGLGSRIYKKFNESVMAKVNEYIVSTLLAPSSAIVNTIPSVIKSTYKPMLNYIAKGPLDQAAFREMTTTYYTMFTAQKSAFQAARLAFKYERSMLTGDVSNFLEQAPAIAGLKGRVLRTIPRFMNATDEYFAQIIYRSYVAGEATYKAVQEGVKKGLTGKDLDAFVEAGVKKATDDSFARKLDEVSVVSFLRQEGIRRGYQGELLDNWVKTQLDKDSALMTKALNQGAMDYADTMLFKRNFGNENVLERSARGYERFINRHPFMRLMGQVFFKTPVRVFEEGLRLTPGINLITPGFIADLKAPVGSARNVRATGEAMLGIGFLTGTLALYANGSITGGGASEDYKRRRSKESGKAWEPYTITFSDGSTFNYRNLDPIATPLKIIANALERYDDLQYRKAQGEFVDNEEKEVRAWLAVAAGSVGQAIRDANLTEGVSQVADLFDAFFNPEQNANTFEKFAGQKLSLLVPRVVTQVQTVSNPFLNDPKSWDQFLRARINPADRKVPKRYNALGQVMTITNPFSALTGINYTSKEMRDKSIDPKSADVLQELSRIETATKSSFLAPYKRSETGNTDLRTKLTSDGTETWYDKWMRYSNENEELTNALHTAIVGNDLSYGTASYDGVKVKVAREIITRFREAAFYKMLSEETGVEERFLREINNKAKALSGESDIPIPQ